MTLPTMRVGLIASATQTVSQPYAGGLEAHTAALAGSLRRRGHTVTIHAADRVEPGVRPLRSGQLRLSPASRRDVSMPAEAFMDEHHAYLSLMLSLDELGYDVVHNNCLHYLPLAMAATIHTPMLMTLHSPPTPWLESAIHCRREAAGPSWVSVSRTNAKAWSHLCDPCEVIPNGVDLDLWRFVPNPKRGGAVWSGRIVPEKGLHLAIDAAGRAGTPLAIAGPIGDRGYFERCMRAAGDAVAYHGHLDSARLATLVGSAGVALVTPCWEEPFGLVAIEAMACGTPVAALARGALPEIVDERTGALAAAGDAGGLARAIELAAARSREDCRAHVERLYSLEAMTERYLRAYRALA
jgi:glycosyltransferase involved in cell wall biosynthesis